MRHGGQRSRRFERRQRERMAQKQLIARGREAARKMQRHKHGIELTQEGRLSLVYAFRYALKQQGGGLDNVRSVMRPHLSEFRIEVLEHMLVEIAVHWAMVSRDPERYALTHKDQEDFRMMLMREIERRKRDEHSSGNAWEPEGTAAAVD